MEKRKSKTGLIVTIIILGITVLAVGGFALWQNLNKQPAVDNSAENSNSEPADDTPASDTPSDDVPADPAVPTVDPSTLSSVNIEPMKIVVYYSKGVGGFDFAVKRTADRTEYVEFSTSALVGTKCTGDEGSIASIIKDPSSPEDKTTISQTKDLNGTTYGLSLTGKNCTGDVALLEKYQTAFSNGFSQLKVME